MSPLKKGPQIKLSELKVPQVLSDLYWDLRDRYLLPAVVVLVVAIAAVPLVLGGSSDSNWENELATGGVADEIAGASAVPADAGELVAQAAPGLRDYRRRLHGLREKDPFSQQFSSGGNESAAVTAGGDEASSPATAPAPAPEGSFPDFTESPPPEAEPDSQQLTWFSYAIDVRVVSLGEAGGAVGRASKSAAGEAMVRHNLPELTMLPNRQTPAAIYIGVTKDSRKALLMLSDQVQGIFGDGVCLLGSTSCQLLAIEPGLPVTIVYGPTERTFRIELLKLRLLRSDQLNRAPLGSGKSEDKGKRKQSWKSDEGLAQLTPPH